MLVLGLAGSPRRGGNSEILLDEALSGARESGAQAEKVIISECKLSPCIACGACNKTGICTLKDDMQELYKRIMGSDVMIFASPIYFYTVSAWAKIAIDRCQALWAQKYVLKEPNLKNSKRGYFIGVGASKGDRLFEGAKLTMKYFFDAAGYEYAGELLVNGVDDKGKIINYTEYIHAAFKLGEKTIPTKLG
jgi:multimeric flavodoxin WrbA